MNLALQLAYHMGFKEIIFVGTDLGWTKDVGTRMIPITLIKIIELIFQIHIKQINK